MSPLIFRFIHVAFALVALGATATFPLWLWSRSMRNRDEFLTVANGLRSVGRVATWTYAGALITGIGLSHMAHLSLLTPWLLAGIILLVDALGMLGVISVMLKKQMAAAENASELGSEIRRKIETLRWLSVALFLSGLTALALMVLRPTF